MRLEEMEREAMEAVRRCLGNEHFDFCGHLFLL